MSVVDGQRANQTTFNDAFVSKTDDSTSVGVLDLNNITDVNSGSRVTNVQRAINELFDAVGMTGIGDATRKRKVAIGKLDSQVYTNTASISSKADGAASSTDNAVARFDSTTGKIIQNSGVIIDDSNNVTGVANLAVSGALSGAAFKDEDDMASDSATAVPTQQSVKAYVDNSVAVVSSPNPSGTVIMFAGRAAPTGYLACDGSTVSRTTYATLFAAIGTAHGIGDGSTTFHLPDLRGKFVRGYDGAAGNDPDNSSRVVPQSGTFTVSGGATTNGSSTITVSSTTGIAPGMTVSGTGIPASAVVRVILSSTTFTLGDLGNSANVNATATNTGLTFTLAKSAAGNYVGSTQTYSCVLDFEVTDGAPGHDDVVDGLTFLRAVKKLTGKNPIVYCGPYFFHALGNGVDMYKEYPLWVAHYGTKCPLVPAPWSAWSFHQFSDKGHVPGVSGDGEDANLFNGSLEQLKKMTLRG
jgi:microcystin-dependent protein